MLIHGDCLEKLKDLEDNSVDSIVTDPPYGLSFMGKKWDYDVPSKEVWQECLRVLKPGGYLLSFAGTRTQHRMAVNIEDAGFEIRDMIAWVYASGFPKSLNIQKALQKKCTCGNMVVNDIHRTTQESEHDLRPVQETNIPQEIPDRQAEGEVLQSSVSEQNPPIQQSESTENVREGQPILEGRGDVETNSRELSGNDLSEMSEGISTNGEERRIYNATQISNGSTPEQATDEDGSSTSHRPQSEQQPDKESCAFCKQLGTQEARRYYSEAEGLGSALKPAFEPITIARKPLGEKTLVDNFIKYGTGGINIDGSRVGAEVLRNAYAGNKDTGFTSDDTRTDSGKGLYAGNKEGVTEVTGRFPANLIHDGSDEVNDLLNDSARFFYCAKASKADRDEGLEGFEDKHKVFNGQSDKSSEDMKDVEKRFTTLPKKNNHPTVKPTKLMQYLVKLVTPPKVPYCPNCVNVLELGYGTKTMQELQQPNNREGQTGQTKELLQQEMLNGLDGQTEKETLDFNDQGLSFGNDARTSESEVLRIHNATSLSDGTTSRQVLGGRRSSTPLERNQGRQQGGESTGTEKTGSRQASETESKTNSVSSLPQNDKSIRACQKCGETLAWKRGVVLDCFMGSGSTGKACRLEGFDFIGIEREEEYLKIAAARIEAVNTLL